MKVFSFMQWNEYFHSVKDEMYHSIWLRLVEWNILSLTSWKYLYHCTHKHSLFVYYFPDSQRSSNSCRIWNSIAYFPDFMVRYGPKSLWMGCIKQILAALLFREWWKIIVPSVKFNLGWISPSGRLNFSEGTIIFHHSPHEQSIFLYYVIFI